MSILDTLEKTNPHHEAKRPYGYRFESIDVYHVDWNQNIDVSNELMESHHWHHIDVRDDSPHLERIIWEIASHIEGNYGLPYNAIIVCRNGHIGIYTPKGSYWWNQERWSELSDFLMGLRSLLDLIH